MNTESDLQTETRRRFLEAMHRALEVRCPRCHAAPGNECFGRQGTERRPHAGRAHALIRSGQVI